MSQRAERGTRPLVVAWTSVSGRQRELANAIGGDPLVVYPLGRSRNPVAKLARYALSSAATVGKLLARRPSAVVVTTPPTIAAAVVTVYCRLTRTPCVLDAHPGTFGLQGDRLSGLLVPLFRRLAALSSAVLVTTPRLVSLVEEWGGTGIVFHEAPSTPASASRAGAPVDVLYVGTFQRDEPFDAILDASRLLPNVRFAVTGDLRLAPENLSTAAYPNITFVGYLASSEYESLIEAARLVVVLTDDRDSVVRAGFEAVWRLKPLVLSDTNALREAFPGAVHVDNSGTGVAAGVTALLDGPPTASVLETARDFAESKWSAQRDGLLAALATTRR
jgi:glycosyltransferase involved in cell wall biosynthesis